MAGLVCVVQAPSLNYLHSVPMSTLISSSVLDNTHTIISANGNHLMQGLESI